MLPWHQFGCMGAAMRFVRAILWNRRGATAVEYGLVLALITLIVSVSIREVAGTTVDMWNMIDTKVAKH
ncbi:Flp family type IVb pilin [Sphingomonas montana]|uniref:Flp family type IVb pilin n=1 Tax=Sphingomonas montana TaxID=1843236 RepID=UPI001F0A8FE5|nr:Flp family type IVb pilin [Sphingomonas montana]